jgi:hypothetical protein
VSVEHAGSSAAAAANSGTVLSAGEAVRYVGELASAAVGIGAFAYFVGYQTAQSYYGWFGASWVLSSLPRGVVLAFSTFPITTFALTVLYYVTWGPSSEAESRLLPRLSDWASWLAVALVLVFFAGGGRLLPTARYLLVLGATGAWAFSTGSLFGLVLLQRTRKYLSWRVDHAKSFYWIVFIGLIQLPRFLGMGTAMLDRSRADSRLPHVGGPALSGDQWRLLTVTESGLLVANLSDTTRFPTLRVLDAVSDYTIKAAEY